MEYESPTGAGSAGYVDADAALGIEGSRVRAAAIENAMRELDHLIAFSGQTPARADLQQVRKAIQAIIGVQARPRLLAALDLYVNPGGSDLSSGLSIGAPVKTISRAIAIAAGADFYLKDVRINLADGTYTNPVSIDAPWVGESVNNVRIVGNVGSPQNVVLDVNNSPGVIISRGCRLILQAFEIRAAGTNGTAIIARDSAAIYVDTGMRFGTCAESHMQADSSGRINLAGAYSIVGNARIHYACTQGHIAGSVPVTLVGPRAFSEAFAFLTSCSTLRVDSISGMSFTGTATGVRHKIFTNSVIDTLGGGANFLPGNSSVAPASGGQYV